QPASTRTQKPPNHPVIVASSINHPGTRGMLRKLLSRAERTEGANGPQRTFRLAQCLRLALRRGSEKYCPLGEQNCTGNKATRMHLSHGGVDKLGSHRVHVHGSCSPDLDQHSTRLGVGSQFVECS